MIDTCRGRIAIPWREDVFYNHPPNWDLQRKEITNSDGTRRFSYQAIHKDGMYVQGNDEFATIVQCSLPRLLFKDNTNLIKNPDDLDKSISQMRLLMLDVLGCESIPRWTRLDLVWNFIGNIDDFITCFRQVRHPSVRNATRTYDGESISWKGKKTEIQIYDKLKEKSSKLKEYFTNTIVRVELRKSIPKTLPKHTKKGEDLTGMLCDHSPAGMVPNFQKCYQYYRNEVTKLSPTKIPDLNSRSPIDFLAFLQANGLKDPNGNPLVDIYLGNKSKASKYRIKRMLRDRICRYKFINFNYMLPEETTPEPIGLNELVRCA